MAALNLTIICTAITIVRCTVDGVTVLGALFLAVLIWAVGAHRAAFWSR